MGEVAKRKYHQTNSLRTSLTILSVEAACKTPNEAALRYLAAKGADMNQVTPWDSCTPIQSAATAGNVNWIRLLLELGAEINGPRGEYGSTLHYALRSKDASVVKYVLDNGA